MRNSSVELFRIIATVLVLIVHFNGWFVDDRMTYFEGITSKSICRSLIEAVGCTCVNCFLVITGWYGLKFKWKHVWNIWSVLAWIYMGFYIISYFVDDNVSVGGLIVRIIAFDVENYYIDCYLMLLVLSPVMNTFIHKYGRRILPLTLAFWNIEIVFDWILNFKCLGFGRGYMLTHFILMYFLGQTAYLYKIEIHRILSTNRCLLTYLVGIIIISVMSFTFSWSRAYTYSNPINVFMSFSLFFVFEREKLHNKAINWIGKSTLAVYIAHCTPPIINYLREWDIYALDYYSYSNYLCLMAVTIIIVFIAAILYDKIRLLFMPYIGNKVCDFLSKITKKYALPNE